MCRDGATVRRPDVIGQGRYVARHDDQVRLLALGDLQDSIRRVAVLEDRQHRGVLDLSAFLAQADDGAHDRPDRRVGEVDRVEDDRLRKDCKALLKLFRETTGMKARMWGSSIVGFGEYTYYRSGSPVQFMATGFSPRKSGPVLYIMPGYRDYSPLLKNLGPHKLGKSCLYLKNLDGVDLDVIAQLIKQGLEDLKKSYSTNY